MMKLISLIAVLISIDITGQTIHHDWNYDRNSIKVLTQINEVIRQNQTGDTLQWIYEINKENILPIDSKEKTVWYFNRVIYQEAKISRNTSTPFHLNGEYITIGTDFFSFEVFDWGNEKRSYIPIGRRSKIIYERTPILNIKISRDGSYTIAKIGVSRGMYKKVGQQIPTLIF